MCRALVALQDIAVLHTHDEIVVEVPERRLDVIRERLEITMTDLPEWAEGLPLDVEIEHGPFYTK